METEVVDKYTKKGVQAQMNKFNKYVGGLKVGQGVYLWVVDITQAKYPDGREYAVTSQQGKKRKDAKLYLIKRIS